DQPRPAPAVPHPVLTPQQMTIRGHSLPTPTVKQATIPTVAPVGEKAVAKALASAAAAAVMPPPPPAPPPVPEPKVERKVERKVEPPSKPAPAPPKPVEVEKEAPMAEPEPATAVAMPDAPVAAPTDLSDESVTSAAPPPPQPVAAKKPAAPPKPPRPTPPPAPVSYKNWQLPTPDLLVKASADSPPAQVVEDLKQTAAVLQATLADFGLDVRVGEVTKGPVITRYEIYPGAGVKVEKITALANNIALAMKASSVRILAPIPGKGAVGIEVPNSTTTIVFLRDVLESKEWKTTNARLPLALGKDISGNVIIGDLTDMPHILIAGATGSGKTVCVNSIITGLLFRMSPEQLKFVFVDPKIVEMQMYASLAHLALPIVNDPKKVPLALRWLLTEMERRYQIFAKSGVRNIQAFNSRTAKAKAAAKAAATAEQQVELGLEVPRDDELKIPDSLPYIVFVVDELADLMMTAPADIEMGITRLAQLARATGIHMILATQRPSVDVVTGVIKANIPARVAFQVASKQDSRVILDANGADKLLGKGDMLYLPPGSSKLIRAQGVFVQDEEIRAVVEFLEKQAPPTFEREITDKLTRESGAGGDVDGEEDEELIEQCVEVIRQTKRASVSILQRRLRIGYTRAARIMDILEERGIVGPHKGAEPRDILIDLDGEIPATTTQ
ncbi:MAG: DNA translocase FtsK, partial [Verrucomicrobiae bacterium]|nr:DNA translocase FtsK [Verrucomicrobiae bacterium]